MRVLPGQDRGAARRADGVGREHVLEERAFARQPIEVRRLVDLRPVRADGVRRVVVGHDEDDVRAVGAEGDTGGECRQDAGEKKSDHAATLIVVEFPAGVAPPRRPRGSRAQPEPNEPPERNEPSEPNEPL